MEQVPSAIRPQRQTKESDLQKNQVFVLDANVILSDAQCISKFGQNRLVVPMIVLEEIDKFKREMTETGRNARQFSRAIDALRKKGSLSKGVVVSDQGGLINIELFPDDIPSDVGFLDLSRADNQILTVCLSLQKREKRIDVVLVTKDINLRVKADALGVPAVDYEPVHVTIEELYTGTKMFDVKEQIIDEFYAKKRVEIPGGDFIPNQYIILRNFENASHTAIGKYSEEHGAIVSLIRANEGIWGIFPKNVEQTFAFDALLDENIQLVTLVGKAGTGKTLLAIAAGLYSTLDEGVYKKMLVSRPIFPLGRDIGYLPGEIEDKLNPWMTPIYDNLDLILSLGNERYLSRPSKRTPQRAAQELIAQGLIAVEPLTYIRGRSIPHQFMIVDEAQNLTPHEIKTIITRAGENTKIILTGDCYQIDNPYVDSANNGLTYVVERFKGQRVSAHINLTKGERSNLAELATQLL
jgi:PhoH-like ATPase